jgi:hypothetical protein
MFLVHFLESAVLMLRGMEENFGILPMPKFDERQESYISFINGWNCAFVAVPINAEPDRTAFIMEALAYASYDMVRPSVYGVKLHHIAARDEESTRMIDLIIETSYLDLNGIFNWGGSVDALYRAVFQGRPLISELEAIESRMQGEIDRFIVAMTDNR